MVKLLQEESPQLIRVFNFDGFFKQVPGDQSGSERQDDDRSSVKSVDGIEGSFFWPMQMPPSQTAKPAVKVTSKQETAWHRPVRPKPPQTNA